MGNYHDRFIHNFLVFQDSPLLDVVEHQPTTTSIESIVCALLLFSLRKTRNEVQERVVSAGLYAMRVHVDKGCGGIRLKKG